MPRNCNANGQRTLQKRVKFVSFAAPEISGSGGTVRLYRSIHAY